MKRTLLFANLMLAAAIIVTGQKTPESMLGTALHQEEVQGDLKGAIAAYQKVVATPGVSRKTAAQALVRMGQCYQKLGDAESRKIYERVVRDYADQKEAATTARTRLGGNTAQSVGIVTRQVWKGPKVDPEGTVSPDGRYLSFVDWETGDLALHELLSGKDRRLTNKGAWSDSEEFAEESAIAPDGKQVAYAWFNGKDRYELRLIGLGESDTAKPRVLYSNQDVSWIAPYDWSPDGKWIAVQIKRTDSTAQMGLVDSGNGSLRVLKSVDWRGSTKLSFSPDGKHLAFDLPPSQDSEQRDIFVLAIDGSREVPAVVHAAMDTVMGWAPDGKKLLFASDRTGSTSIWAFSFVDGKTQGAPELIKSDVGGISSLSLTRSGAFYFGVRVGGPDVYVASLDFNSGKVLSTAFPTEQFTHHNRQPDWSPDGKYLAYVTLGRGRSVTLSVQAMETGTVRELGPKLNYAQWPRWSPDSTSFVVQGRDFKGRNGIYKVDVRTGDAELIVSATSPNEYLLLPLWAPDGKKIFYSRNSQAPAIVERDLASGSERELLPTHEVTYQSVSVSPDGTYVACLTRDPATKQGLLMVVPLGGGKPREVLRLPFGGRFTAWTPDSRSILFTKHTSRNGDDGSEVWMIPATGGQAKKIDFGLTGLRGLRIQPGGNKVAFFKSAADTDEVWALENFLPALKASK